MIHGRNRDTHNSSVTAMIRSIWFVKSYDLYFTSFKSRILEMCYILVIYESSGRLLEILFLILIHIFKLLVIVV